MIEGKCSKCGERYYGWALRFERNRYCNICGAALDITEDGISTPGYSPFEAEKYRLNVAEILDPDKDEN